ncbi:hypothetical protein V3C99_016632 [Haemonchus contortus]|uniref:Protein popA1 n=2 Tax=Haemonchus contortus TaxID=6289 RepID=A0A7I5EDA2_HAECO
MGSAGMALGPDGKPLKRQERRGMGGRGMSRPMRGMGGMAGGPMRGGAMGMMGQGYGRPAPYGMGPMGAGYGRGPMPYGGPMGYAPDPNVSFFNAPQPAPPPPPMGDARTGPMQPGQQMTPSANTVGKGSVGASTGATNKQTDSNNENKSNAGDVPGFGTNSSIHELFGKMVWKKMEAIKDEAVIDRLQNRIMNMIHEALAQQSEASNGGGGSNQNAAVNGGQSSGNFRSF